MTGHSSRVIASSPGPCRPREAGAPWALPSTTPLVPMSPDRSDEETTVFAIYSTRRNAERAREYLQGENIETFVRADDAGGMHPQMQRPHGVKLVGMRSAAQDAYEALNAANLLPEAVEERPDPPGERLDDETAASLTFSMEGTAGTLGIAAIVLIVLYLLLT